MVAPIADSPTSTRISTPYRRDRWARLRRHATVNTSILWRIHLMGELRVVGPDRVVAQFRTQKTGLLLALLACHAPHALTRHRAIHALWPEADLVKGSQNLRQALASLRRQFEPAGVARGSVIQGDQEQLGLNLDVVAIDVLDFERSVAAVPNDSGPERLEGLLEAAALFTGVLLPGHDDDWLTSRRDQLNRGFRTLALDLLKEARAQGVPEMAIPAMEAADRTDLEAETIQLELVRLYCDLGRRADGTAAYQRIARRYLELLEDEVPVRLAALAREFRLDHRRPPRPAGLAAAGASPRTPAPATTTTRARLSPSLPPRLTRYFGRTEELLKLREWLTDGRYRLVTITGTGGAGKTRLATEIAHQLADSADRRVHFAGLADLLDASLTASTVLRLLRTGQPAGHDPVTELTLELAGPSTILVLDNMEQLGEAGALFVQTLLQRVPNLTCLVTSRLLLGVPGERVLDLAPLAVPDEGWSLERVAETECARLYFDRAQSARPDFAISASNYRAIGELCRRLEGLPLAIELAAARARTMGPAQVLEHLNQSGVIEARSGSGIADRHRTLEAAIDWSVNLLHPELRMFFLRLSVFRGGWSLQAAAAVGLPEAHDNEPSLRALDFLGQLRSHSLIAGADGGSDMRFTALDSIREYGKARLPSLDPEAWARHARYYCEFAETVEEHLQRAEQPLWLDRVEREHSNLRAAVQWCLEDPSRTELALRIVGPTWRYWHLRGHLEEGSRLLASALSSDANADAPLLARARALNAAGNLDWLSGRLDGAENHFLHALAEFQQLGDALGECHVFTNLGTVASLRQQPDRAEQYYLTAITNLRRLAESVHLANALANFGCALIGMERLGEAEQLLLEAGGIHRRQGNQGDEAAALGNLAEVFERTHRDAEALGLRLRTMRLFWEVGDLRSCIQECADIGGILSRQGRAQIAHDAAAVREVLARLVDAGQGPNMLDLESRAWLERELELLFATNPDPIENAT